MASTYFDDEHFQNLIVSLLVKDRQFLRASRHLLTPKDFRPIAGSNGSSNHRWIVASKALEHYDKYSEPIRDMLPTELKEHCRKTRLEGDQKEALIEYGLKARRKKIVAVESILDKVIQYKKEVLKAQAVKELMQLQGAGELTDDKWYEICQKGVAVMTKDPYQANDYFKELEKRIERRDAVKDNRFPILYIDDLDYQVRAIARGHLGLVLAPYKRGKSLFLIHIALAYVLQKLNVLYITLEDPRQDVEDRFDANVTCLPIKKLTTMTKTVRTRFQAFKRLLRTRMKVLDGTEGGFTVPMIDAAWEHWRNRGFTADAVIVDYDEEIKASNKREDRRLEYADIYREMRQFAAKKDLLMWTAAQTQRNTVGLKILSGDKLADDISKVRKVACALSLGQGDWGSESIYVHVAAHKFDRQHVGCNIMPDLERLIIYDREKTRLAKANPPAAPQEEETYE